MGDFYVFVDAPDTGLYGNESPDSDCWIVVRLLIYGSAWKKEIILR